MNTDKLRELIRSNIEPTIASFEAQKNATSFEEAYARGYNGGLADGMYIAMKTALNLIDMLDEGEQ